MCGLSKSQKLFLSSPSKCSATIRSWSCICCLLINDLPAPLPCSVSCSYYADNLAIWSSSSSVPIAVEASQGALFRLERWCLPLNSSKCEASFFSLDPHQANLQLNLFLLGSRLRCNPTPTFLRFTFDRTVSFSKHVSSLKAKFFPRLKVLRCIFAPSWGSLRSPSLFSIKNASTERLVAPSPAASRPPLSHFFSLFSNCQLLSAWR